MTRVVIDTNVFVSSFFGGNPRKIIDIWKTGRVLLCLSPPIVDEYMEVLHRLSLGKEGEFDGLLQLFSRGYYIVFTHSSPNLNIVTDDPDDDKFLECAVALDAKYVISGDKALLSVKNYMGIKILSPRKFLECIGENKII